MIFLFLILFISNNSYSNEFFFKTLADSAFTLTYQKVIYDPSYTVISYPYGDVAPNKGVCSDVIIRAYRKLGIDLQKEVHEDMKNNFKLYPKIWGLKKPDKNIDHRRVPNLMKFFERKGTIKKITFNPQNYTRGDIVCWSLGGGITHIGLVSNIKVKNKNRYYMIHNIGNGQVLEDCLFDYKIIGHYCYKK